MARMSKEEAAKRMAIKQKAQTVAQYFNRMEEIITTTSMEEIKTEKITELTMLIGKSMAMFSELTTELNVYGDDGGSNED